ncbi:HAD family hydrolase [Methanomethylophilus alvi]|uniref:HAD family hydrolase n=2 Tax=Methanomethylophilus alvi TaxID=1291540 RepID=UPI0037DD6F56
MDAITSLHCWRISNMTKAPIKAVGFDLDGTLFETHVNYSALYDSDKTILSEHNISFLDVFGENPELRRKRLPIKIWLNAHNRSEEYDEICKEIDELSLFYETQFINEAKEYPGSIKCIDFLKSKGLKVGLLTRGGYHYAKLALEKFKVFDKMDAIVGRDYSCYDEAKPSPIAMINFAKELKVRPEEILYIGDNATDYRSAVDAGATFIGVLSGAASKEFWEKTSRSIRTIDYAGDISYIIDEYIY